MTIKLYIDYLSQPARAVLSFCLVAKIPHEVVQTRLNKLETRSDSFKKINPMMKVPAMHDTENDLKLAESHTIMRYLAEKYPQHVRQWYPKDDLMKRAKINEYLDFHHTNTRKCANLIFNTLFAKKLGVEDPTFNPEKAKKQAYSSLKLITKHYLADQNYLLGSQPTIADLSAYYQIQFLMFLGENFNEWKIIQSWLSRMGQIPEVKQANFAFIKLITKQNPSAKL